MGSMVCNKWSDVQSQYYMYGFQEILQVWCAINGQSQYYMWYGFQEILMVWCAINGQSQYYVGSMSCTLLYMAALWCAINGGGPVLTRTLEILMQCVCVCEIEDLRPTAEIWHRDV